MAVSAAPRQPPAIGITFCLITLNCLERRFCHRLTSGGGRRGGTGPASVATGGRPRGERHVRRAGRRRPSRRVLRARAGRPQPEHSAARLLHDRRHPSAAASAGGTRRAGPAAARSGRGARLLPGLDSQRPRQPGPAQPRLRRQARSVACR